MLRSRLAMKAALVSALGIGALFAPKRADASTTMACLWCGNNCAILWTMCAQSCGQTGACEYTWMEPCLGAGGGIYAYKMNCAQL